MKNDILNLIFERGAFVVFCLIFKINFLLLFLFIFELQNSFLWNTHASTFPIFHLTLFAARGLGGVASAGALLVLRARGAAQTPGRGPRERVGSALTHGRTRTRVESPTSFPATLRMPTTTSIRLCHET